MTSTGLDRRRALTGAAGLGLVLPVLAACGSDDAEQAPEGGSGGDSGGGSGGDAGNGGGAGLAATSDIPEGGGTIFEDDKVVVTQPASGDFKAFSAVCTHQGCVVSALKGQEIQCPCHGSAFSITDGSVVNGPATQPLEEVPITVDGDQITLS